MCVQVSRFHHVFKIHGMFYTLHDAVVQTTYISALNGYSSVCANVSNHLQMRQVWTLKPPLYPVRPHF